VPNYSYACTECGHAFDIYQAFSDDALTTCPQCQGRLRKKFSAVGVVFKGSGFYRTDSRSGNGSTNGAGKDSSGKEKSGAGKETSSSSGSEGSGGSSEGSTSKEAKPAAKSNGSTAKKPAAKAGATA